MYESIGSRLVIPPLLETDAMNTTVDDDEREDDRLSLEEFCSRYAPLVSDEQTRVYFFFENLLPKNYY